MLRRIAATAALLAACDPVRTASVVAPTPAWVKGCVVLVLIGVFLLTWTGIGLLLDSAATRHIFHFHHAKDCGRCDDELRQRERDLELAQAAARKATSNG